MLSLTKIAQDWKHPLQASNFTGYIPSSGEKEPAGTVLRCLTLNRIPCNQEACVQYALPRATFAVLRVVKRGWINAPYKKPKATTTNKAPSKPEKEVITKHLFEEFTYKDREGVKVYNFTKTNNPQDKGPRVDDCFAVICPGQCLTFSMKSEFVYKENTFPTDVDFIEPYQIVDLTILPSTLEQAKSGDKGGYGIKLHKVRVHDSSVYSYVKDIQSVFEPSLESAQNFVKEMLQAPLYFPNTVPATEVNPTGTVTILPGETIRNVLENRALMYHIPADQVNPRSYITSIRPDLEYFRIQPPEADQEVAQGVGRMDVHIPTLLRLLNTEDEMYAKTLIDFALAASAVSFLAVTDEWYCKNDSILATTRVIPMVNLTKLLGDVNPAQFDLGKLEVDFPVSFPPPTTISSLAISVGMRLKDPKALNTEIPTMDFMLVSPSFSIGQDGGYEINFIEGDDILLTAYLNPKAGRGFGGTEPGVPTAYQRVARKRTRGEADE